MNNSLGYMRSELGLPLNAYSSCDINTFNQRISIIYDKMIPAAPINTTDIPESKTTTTAVMPSFN